MSVGVPEKYEDVGVSTKANVYFDGKVVSHTVTFKDGTKKTIGLIYPGTYTFNTAAPERMDMVEGSCRYRLKGQDAWTDCAAPAYFDVAGSSAFDIVVEGGITEYVCSFK